MLKCCGSVAARSTANKSSSRMKKGVRFVCKWNLDSINAMPVPVRAGSCRCSRSVFKSAHSSLALSTSFQPCTLLLAMSSFNFWKWTELCEYGGFFAVTRTFAAFGDLMLVKHAASTSLETSNENKQKCIRFFLIRKRWEMSFSWQKKRSEASIVWTKNWVSSLNLQ